MEWQLRTLRKSFRITETGLDELGYQDLDTDAELAQQFKNALNFWTRIIDLEWHRDESSSCAIQLVEGTPAILRGVAIARAQFPEAKNFQGLIAFDTQLPLSKKEMYLIAVHEIGHMLGLRHNRNTHSVMYYFNLEGPEVLDLTDLRHLSFHHRLRFAVANGPLKVEQDQFGD